MSKRWTSPAYTFYESTPTIGYENKRRYHAFKCLNRGCKHTIRRYLDGKDATSTGNMYRHAVTCFGAEAVDSAKALGTADAARAQRHGGAGSASGTITAAFERTGRGKVTYSHKQHSKTEARCVPLIHLCRTLV